MDEAGRCDRVLLMREGRIIADATPDELRATTGEDDLERAFLVLAEGKAAHDEDPCHDPARAPAAGVTTRAASR